jgi:predicted permease
MSDLRFAFRTLAQSPAFTLVAILSLALGAGANTAIFSLVDAVMLKMLPVDHPGELYFVNTKPMESGGVQVTMLLSNRALGHIRKQAHIVAAANSYDSNKLAVGVDGKVAATSGYFVSGNYFSTLGVNPVLGRAFGAADDRPDARVAVVGFGYWQSRFGGDPHVLGRAITANGVPFTIVGVAPRGFFGLSVDAPADVLLPYATLAQVDAGHASGETPSLDSSAGTLVVRLPRGASMRAAETEITAILRQSELEKAGGEASNLALDAIRRAGVELSPAALGTSIVRMNFALPLKVLMGLVGLVMLIACANIANLLLAKGSARSREIAIRLSLGSTRWRLARQLLTESLLLSAAGGALGLLFALWAGDAILRVAGITSISPDWNLRVFAFTAGIVILNALLFGAAPAFRSTAIDFAAALKGSRSTGDASRSRFARSLVVAQIALSLSLVVGAGLFIKTFERLNHVDLGYARDHVLMAAVDLNAAGYPASRLAEAWRDTLARAAAIPGVRAATLSGDRLMAGFLSMGFITVPGYTPRNGENPQTLWVITNAVGPHFVSTAGMRLISGRDFDEADASRNAAIVNQTFANHFFAGADPIGRTISFHGGKDPVEIVGLVANIKYFSMQNDDNDVVFQPLFHQSPPPSHANLILRTTLDPESLTPALREAVRAVDSNLPLLEVATMDEQVSKSLSQPRLIAILSGFFGVLALALASIGLYGVLAFSVSRRTGEIGIRMALGARSETILNMILSETARLAVVGIAAGLAIAFAAARLVKSLLFGVTPYDATSMIVAVVVLVAAAFAAGWIPARRASKVDPMVALRHE